MKICSILLFTAMATLSGFGQDLKSVVPNYKPGATLSYRVSFDGDPAFTAVVLHFHSATSVPNEPEGLTNSFGLGHFVKVKAGVYDVDDKIPNNAITGDYRLLSVSAAISPAVKNYDAQAQNIVIHIDNDAKFDFPPAKVSKEPN